MSVREVFFEDCMVLMIPLCLVLLAVMCSVPSRAGMQSLSNKEMSEVRGADAIVVDLRLDSNDPLQFGSLDYTDADGYDGGMSGTLRLENVKIGDAFTDGNSGSLNGFRLNADGNLDVGVNNRAGIALQLPETPNLELQTDNIYPGDPSGGSLGTVKVNNLNLNESVLKLAGSGEGLVMDADLKLTADYVDLIDNGTLRIEDVTLDDGSGNKAAFTDFSIDADGQALSSGRGGVVAELPNSNFDLTTGNTYLGDPADPAFTSGMGVRGVDLGKSYVKVGAKP